MSSRKVIMLSLALLIGVATFFIFRSSVNTPDAGAPAPAVQTTEVLAAAHDMPMGTILKETDLKWIPWAENAQNSKLFLKGQTEIASMNGAVLRQGTHADEPLLANQVVQPHEAGFLAAVLNPGMRAVSVTLTPQAEVAGFIFPGDRVDVILTHSFKVKTEKDNDDTERRLSQTIITNVRVLALDQKSDDQTTDPKVATLATLEVTPKQAEKIALAADMGGTNSAGHGGVTLVLRSLATDGKDEPAEVTGPTMDSDVSPVFSRVMHLQKVEIMRGKDTTESVFQKQR